MTNKPGSFKKDIDVRGFGLMFVAAALIAAGVFKAFVVFILPLALKVI